MPKYWSNATIVYLWHTVREPLIIGATNIVNRLRAFVFPGESKVKMKIRTVRLSTEQIAYLSMLVGADMKSRVDDHRHAIAYGADYEDAMIDEGMAIMHAFEMSETSHIDV